MTGYQPRTGPDRPTKTPTGGSEVEAPVKTVVVKESNKTTNKSVLESVIKTCKQNHHNCESCPYWLKNKFNCIWHAHKIIGKDVMAYWGDEIEERIL